MKWLMSGGLALILSCSPNSEKKDELWKRCNTHLSQGKQYDGINPTKCRTTLADLDEYIKLAPDEPDGYLAQYMVNKFMIQSVENQEQIKTIKREMYCSLDKMFDLVKKGKTFKRFEGSADYLKATYEELKIELGK